MFQGVSFSESERLSKRQLAPAQRRGLHSYIAFFDDAVLSMFLAALLPLPKDSEEIGACSNKSSYCNTKFIKLLSYG